MEQILAQEAPQLHPCDLPESKLHSRKYITQLRVAERTNQLPFLWQPSCTNDPADIDATELGRSLVPGKRPRFASEKRDIHCSK